MPHFDPRWSQTTHPFAAWAAFLPWCLGGLLLLGLSSLSGAVRAAPANDSAAVSQVRLNDEVVFELRAAEGGASAEERARVASRNLARAANAESDVKSVRRADGVTVYVGELPIVKLTSADAVAAGNRSLEVHARDTEARIGRILQAERRRMRLADTVFSLSLAMFLALVTFYVVRKSRVFAERALGLIEAHRHPLPALRVSSVELLGAGSVRMAALLALSLARWVVPSAVVYAYLVVVTSLFVSTRSYAEKLSGWVLEPLSQLVSRLASTLPVLVIVLFAAVVLWLALRASRQLFRSIARGETQVPWLERELADTVGRLVRLGIVVVGLVFAAPLITGSESGAFAKLGSYLLVALTLASAPILASASVGAVMVLRRHARLGDDVSIGRHRGAIRRFGVTDMVLEWRDDVVRVPYLLALVLPLTIRASNRLVVELAVDGQAAQTRVLELLTSVVRELSPEGSVRLVHLDGDGAHYALSLPTTDTSELRQRILLRASESLSGAGVCLARSRGRGSP